jgi:hypothetical protein
MSIQFDISNVKDYEDICLFEKVNGLKEYSEGFTMILSTMMVTGITDLTEKTISEYIFRLTILEALSGPLLPGGRMLAQQVRYIWKFVGLTTNISPQKLSAWIHNQRDIYEGRFKIDSVSMRSG